MRLLFLSICQSPLTHMAGTQGNEQVVMREPVMTAGGTRWVPMLTGNAIRHRMIRSSAARYLVEQWGLSGELSMQQLNFLFHGGRLYQKGGRIDLALQSRVYDIFPHLKLLGCSLPGHIVPGHLKAGRGLLVCRENHSRLERMLPDGFSLPSPLRPATAYIQPWTYYRSHAVTSAPDLLPPEAGEEPDPSLMIMSGQSVVPGAAFLHSMDVYHVDDIALGCLIHSLRVWQQYGSTIGGQSNRGHGKLDTLMHCDRDDTEELASQYVNHVASVAREGRELLDEIFGVANATA